MIFHIFFPPVEKKTLGVARANINAEPRQRAKRICHCLWAKKHSAALKLTPRISSNPLISQQGALF